MAKKEKVSNKFIDKKVNYACLALGLLYTILAIFAYSTILDSITFGSLAINASADTMLKIFENEEYYRIFDIIVWAFAAIFQFVALINVIRVVLGWFGFIGKKDSYHMARKLAKLGKTQRKIILRLRKRL